MAKGPSVSQHDRWLFMGTGWQWDDAGTWRVTERAKADADFMRGRRGHSRRHENRPHDPVLPSQGAEGFRPQELPTPVVCPHCGTPQRLDPEALALDPWHHEHSVMSRAADGGVSEGALCCGEGRYLGEPTYALLRKRIRD